MRKLALTLLLPILATGCTDSIPIQTIAIDSRCRTDKIITYSDKHDSPETIVQVRLHNASLRAVCPDMR